MYNTFGKRVKIHTKQGDDFDGVNIGYDSEYDNQYDNNQEASVWIKEDDGGIYELFIGQIEKIDVVEEYYLMM